MFQRRVPLTQRQRLREAFWPSMGVTRLTRYYGHRVGRMPGSSYSIATGIAVGIAISFTPFVGFHILIGTIFCMILRSSIVGMVLGTLFMGNPWTFPFIWIATYEIGRLLTGIEGDKSVLEQISLENLFKNPLELLTPMLVGSVPLGVIFGTLAFLGVRRLVTKYREDRLARIFKELP